jgi:hypothetical protein
MCHRLGVPVPASTRFFYPPLFFLAISLQHLSFSVECLWICGIGVYVLGGNIFFVAGFSFYPWFDFLLVDMVCFCSTFAAVSFSVFELNLGPLVFLCFCTLLSSQGIGSFFPCVSCLVSLFASLRSLD